MSISDSPRRARRFTGQAFARLSPTAQYVPSLCHQRPWNRKPLPLKRWDWIEIETIFQFFFAWNGMSVSVSASSTLNRKPLVILHQISRARLQFLRRTAKALPVERQSEDCLHLNIFVPIKQGRCQGKLWLLSLKRSLIWGLFFYIMVSCLHPVRLASQNCVETFGRFIAGL